MTIYDLEERTYNFASNIRIFLSLLKISSINFNDKNQLLRSSGSIGANYIEANEALSKKDFIHRIKICRKEAKESIYWLRLLSIDKAENTDSIRKKLIKEASELMLIFGSIIQKSK